MVDLLLVDKPRCRARALRGTLRDFDIHEPPRSDFAKDKPRLPKIFPSAPPYIEQPCSNNGQDAVVRGLGSSPSSGQHLARVARRQVLMWLLPWALLSVTGKSGLNVSLVQGVQLVLGA